MKPNGWTCFNEEQWLKWKDTLKHESDFPDKEPFICKFFSCAHTLSLEERLCGEFCQLHSNLPKNNQPHGSEDPTLFVSY